MPDVRRHRGPHPEDARLFAPSAWPALRRAVADLSWLLSRSYALPSALKLVGDRYGLDQRQRTAVMRSACSDQARSSRQSRQLDLAELPGQALLLDGYNLLTTIEAALGGGVILHGRDGCFRDMASIHGTYRRVEETPPALERVGQCLQELRLAQCIWFLDSPVSNSGRLKVLIQEMANARRWNWQVEVVVDPDPILAQSPQIVATTDSVILDRCRRWVNLAGQVLSAIPEAQIVEMSEET